MTNINYPFAQEMITDDRGNICQVILNFDDYQQLLEGLEDEALYRAMKIKIDKTPMSREEALKALEEE